MSELLALFLGPPRRTLAVAESLTCGRLQAAIGAISGTSGFFLGGITAYALEQKVRHLGVDRALAESCDAVSAEVAVQMAAGVCRLFGSDIAAATTGYAEPAPERGIAHPLAYWAITYGGRVARAGRIERPGLGRVAMQDAVVVEVLAGLEDVLRAG